MPKIITINEGVIFVNEVRAGSCRHALKHGYHPAVLLDMDGHERAWFELDEEDLQKKIFAKIEKLVGGKVQLGA